MTNILVVENDYDTRELLEFILLREGYEIWSEVDGEATLAAVESTTPDLVLLDWMLPSRNGIDVCRALRAQPKFANTPIVMVSAKTTVEDIRSCLRAGADDYITNPSESVTSSPASRQFWLRHPLLPCRPDLQGDDKHAPASQRPAATTMSDHGIRRDAQAGLSDPESAVEFAAPARLRSGALAGLRAMVLATSVRRRLRSRT